MESTASGEPTMTLVCKQNTVVAIWALFGFEADAKGEPQEPDYPKCHLCNTEVYCFWLGHTFQARFVSMLELLRNNVMVSNIITLYSRGQSDQPHS